MPPELVQAGPTKRFFVEMLTRDIELEDAVLDLLDNCIDGILRTVDAPEPEEPYKGFWAKITAAPDRFEIRDNCGGIPVDIAKASAFMFGRPDDRDGNLKTVGMYGIGMKRAIFKMGREARVASQPGTGPYVVEIPKGWFAADEWELTLNHTDDALDENGTVVTVAELLPGIAHQFDEERSAFLGDLRREISRLFALIIKKGFRVVLNGQEVEPVDLVLLAPGDFSDAESIQPYIFQGVIDGVDVDLAVGFYRRLASEREVEEETESPRDTSHRAGWTVICNDRVVLYGDRTLVTGWGRGTVPAYHSQFRAIAGVVTFESTDSMRLPLNTTKRGLDTSNTVYLTVLDYMQEGTKLFTNFTNRWKAREREADTAFKDVVQQPVRDLGSKVKEASWSPVRKIEGRGDGSTARRYTPSLPQPSDEKKVRRISFSRPADEVASVAVFLFDDADRPPQEVGERCFERTLSEVEGEA